MEPEVDGQLEGFLSVRAALLSGSRPLRLISLRADKSDSALRWLSAEAGRRGVPVQRVSAEAIDAAAGGKTHGGILAQVGPRRFVPLEELLAGNTVPAIAMLDGVEDPFNFGQAVRSLYASGVSGLVVRPRNWMSAAATVARASAGASELMPTAIAETAADALAFFKERGLVTAIATEDAGATSLDSANLTVPLFLLIGGEKRGISRGIEAQADLRLHIPAARLDAPALGTAAAAAVLGYEIARQRRV